MSKLVKGVNDLLTVNPGIADEWDQEKNVERRPDEVLPGSGIKVWWKCDKGHSWEAVINTRAVRGYGCPYCEGRRVWPGFNDLATTMPEIAAQWDYEKNVDLNPTQVLSGSDKRVWWRCCRGHSWKTAIYHRKAGHGCPKCEAILSNLRVGENDLETHNPEMLREWDYDRNIYDPDEVTYSSKQSVWWKCEQGHSWQATVSSRVYKGRGCPYCAGQKVLKGYNDLATTNPELTALWDYEKNGDLRPEDVTAGKDMKVWWKCDKGHSWRAVVYSRKMGNGCPVCAGQAVLTGYNDLATVKPELLKEWDYEKNRDMCPEKISSGANRYAWWICDKGHSWKALISSRSCGRNCPVCTGRKVLKGENDLLSVNPALASEWDYSANDIGPDCVTAGSSKKVWWLCSKHHRWQATIAARMGGTGCPYCSGKDIMPGFNDFKTLHPDIIKERWDYEKNKSVDPGAIASNSRRIVWWRCDKGHSWRSSISNSLRCGCPICCNKKVLVGYNDLASVHPELTAEWDYSANGDVTPESVAYMTGREVYWICEIGHSYKISVYKRHKGSGCPYCSGRLALKGFNTLADLSSDYAKDWDYERNTNISPEEIMPHSNRKVWWKCPQGHSYRSNLNAHLKGHGCPYCYGLLPSRTRIVP